MFFFFSVFLSDKWWRFIAMKACCDIIKGSFEQYSVVSINEMSVNKGNAWMAFRLAKPQKLNSIWETMSQKFKRWNKKYVPSAWNHAIGEVSFKVFICNVIESISSAFHIWWLSLAFFFLFFYSIVHVDTFLLFDSHQIYFSALFICRIYLGGRLFSIIHWCGAHLRAKYYISTKDESIQTT